MAKEQKRGNREARKPKQIKAPPAAVNPFAAPGKGAANGNVPRGKG